MLWEGSGGVLSRAGLTPELLLFSFLGVVELGASSGLALLVFSGGLATEEDEESFFLVTTGSPVFFFALSVFAFTPSVLTLAFTF